MMTGHAGARRKLTVGLALAMAGSGMALAPGAHAAAGYQNGGVGWVGTDQIWHVANADGSDQRAVTPSGGGYDPANDPIKSVLYSHDGTRAAFLTATSTPGTTRLWVSKADGTGAKKISDAISGGASALAWASDDSAVYYAASAGSATHQIFVAPIDGAAAHPLFSSPTGFDDTDPAVAGDGRVAFIRAKAGGGERAIYVLAPGTSAPRLLPGTTGALALTFSPDGGRVAMVTETMWDREMHPFVDHLTVMNADGSGAHVMYDSPYYHAIGRPSWSPDGTRIALWDDGNLDFMVTVPGSVPMLLTQAAPGAWGDAVSWQPGRSNVGPRPVLDRIGGADRRGTALAASQWSYDALHAGGRQANVAVLSRDDQFADALAGNALAAEKHGPLLLTGTDALDGAVKAELKRILAPGSTVYILGGEQALSPAVEQAVKAAGFTPKRLQGPDRFATSVAIAKEIAPNGPHTALVATGVNFPDALTAGAAAAQDLAGGVVLLSQDGSLPQVTKDYLAGVDPHKCTVYGVGGQGVAALKAAFPAWDGLTVPLAGADRYGTAYQVAHSKLFGLDKPVTVAGIATGAKWPDALSGGALIAAQHGPLLLTGPDGLTAEENSVLTTEHLSGLAVFGGVQAVADGIANMAANSAFGVGNWDPATNRQAPALP